MNSHFKKALVLFLICFGLSQMGCNADDEFKIPSTRLVFSPGTSVLPSSVVATCSTGIANIRQGASSKTSDDLQKIIKESSIAKRRECANELADYLEASLRVAAASPGVIKRADDDEVDFDLLIIGSGVHGAMLTRNLSLRKPDLRILMIDHETHPANQFHTDAYRLNSPGVPDNTNAFPKTPVSINEHAEPVLGTQQAFPVARQLWNQVIYNAFASNALVSLNTKAVNIVKGKNLYVVRLEGPAPFANGRTVLVKKIVLATGLGQPILPRAEDPGWLKRQLDAVVTAKTSVPSSLPLVMNYDDLFEINAALARKGKSVFDFLKGKKIGIMGAADSGKIAVEFLTGYAPIEAYRDPVTGADQYASIGSIVWCGQLYNSYALFAAGSDTKKRYVNTGFSNIFAGVDRLGHRFNFMPMVNKASKLKPSGSGVEISFVGGAPNDNVDVVISAIGYRNDVDKFLLTKAAFIRSQIPAGQNISLKMVREQVTGSGRFSTSFENVAKKVCLPEKPCDEIYVIGTAVGHDRKVSKGRYDEGLTKNPASIETLAPLTEAFSEHLF